CAPISTRTAERARGARVCSPRRAADPGAGTPGEEDRAAAGETSPVMVAFVSPSSSPVLPVRRAALSWLLPALPPVAVAPAAAGSPAPNGLMCELLARPELAEITDPRPDLSWIVNSRLRDDLQTGYRIRLARARGDLRHLDRCVWDSGRVPSD